ncbi:MAG: hypothetical protein AB8G96_15275 [Phycisphaerales bacterium]
MSGIPNTVAASALQSVQTQRVAGADRNRRRAEETKPRNERADRLDLESDSANAVEAADAVKSVTEDLPEDRSPEAEGRPSDASADAAGGEPEDRGGDGIPVRPRLDLQA